MFYNCQPHAPVLVLRQVLDGRQKALSEELDTNHLIWFVLEKYQAVQHFCSKLVTVVLALTL